MPEDFTPPPLSDYRGPSRAPAASVMPPSPVTAAPPADGAFTPPPLTAYKGPAGRSPSHPLDEAADGLLTHQTENKDRLIGSAWPEVDPQKAVYSLSNAILHPLDTMHEMGRQNSEIWQRAKDAYDKGDYTGAAAHALNYVMNGIPGVGSSLESAGQKFASGDVQGGIGHTLGLAANLYGGAKLGSKVEVPEVPDLVNNTVTTVKNGVKKAVAAHALAKSAYKSVNAAPPVPDLVNAYGPSDVRFNERAPTAIADIKAHAPGDITTNEHLSLSSPDQRVRPALDANRAAWNKWFAPAAERGVTADGAPIVSATEQALKSTATPSQRDAILAEAQSRFARPIPVTELQEMLNEKNGELRGYYSKSPAARAAAEQAGAVTGRSQALLETQAQQIRDLLYKALDPENGGAGPREIQRRYGGIKMLTEEADAARNKALGEQAGTPVGKAAKLAASVLDIPGKAMTGKLEESLTAPSEALHGKTNHLVKRAFSNAPEFTPYPEPPAQPNVTGLLNAPPLVTPSPTFDRYGNPTNDVADASYVHAQPATPPFRVGFPADAPKQLPAASSQIGVNGTTVPDIIDRASRGQGTPRPLLQAPNPQSPQPTTVPGRPGGVMPPGLTQPTGEVSLQGVPAYGAPVRSDIISPGSREWLRPIGDVGAGQSTLASPLGQTPATSHLSGVSRISTEGGISPAQINVAKSAADKMVVGRPTTLRNSSGQSVTVIKLQDGKIYTFNPNAPNVKPAR